MYKYLLDTHILLWALLSPEKLSERVAVELKNPENELWLSPITTWEVVLLAEKGKIMLQGDPSDWMKNVLETIPFGEASLNHEISLQSRKIDLPHNDPADRFIAATAQVYDLILITADKHLIAATKNFSVLPN